VTTSPLACFAQAAPGLETLVADELAGLGVRSLRVERGGAAFDATVRQLYAANLWLRTAGRVLVRRASFTARSFADLERRAAELPWDLWLATGARPVWRVSSSRSVLYHTGAVAERLARVAGDGEVAAWAGRRVGGKQQVGGPHRDGERDGDGEEQLVVVRVASDVVTISIDSSGEPLHRRGWRLAGAKAPLRETLAAALLAAAGWNGAARGDVGGDRGSGESSSGSSGSGSSGSGGALADPFCGSGTIAIEAALAALDRAPGAGRTFAFQRWPSFEPGTWASVTGEARRRARPSGSGPPIVAADRDAGAVEATRANAARAGVAADVDIRHGALSTFDPPSAEGWLVSNPPYGRRVSGDGDLRDLYASLGKLLRGPAAGWRAALLVADPALARQVGVAWEEHLRTTNGGIPVRLLVSRAPGDRPAPPARRGSRRDARRAGGPGTAPDRPRPPADRTG
jgi:putative N6-adenine-specific DNA methylase